jgi:hypothetical protein
MEVWLPGAKVYQVRAGSAQLLGIRHHGHGGRDFNAVNPLGQLNCGLSGN